MSNIKYPFDMRPLSEDEGSGWLISFPDLPGCISDGETPEEAMKNGAEALDAWIEAWEFAGKVIPLPGDTSSGKFMTRIPKTLHSRLAIRAKQEGVSMNSLVSMFIAESLTKREILSDN
jgi:antitoxin HicB